MSHSILTEQVTSQQTSGTRHHAPFDVTEKIEQEAIAKMAKIEEHNKKVDANKLKEAQF